MGGNGGEAASSFGAVINVPFAWEHKPGVSKLAAANGDQISRRRHHLPPPPPLKCRIHNCRQESEFALPVVDDDPFLVAYRKCTDQETAADLFEEEDDDEGRSSRLITISRRSWSSARKKRASTAAGLLCPTTLASGALSCKYSCGVRSDNLVRVQPSSQQRQRQRQRQNAILSAASPTTTKLYKG
ncbi:unnamed protein product [Linum trigynum]|uniref:Uncharacterized protein n=1 Tax=Linum trigynum TaxID=586398 RepID=A0AAV2FCD9_9ROSI